MRPFAIVLLLFATGIAGSAWSSVPWKTGRLTIHARQRPVKELLKEFADYEDIPVTFGSHIQGSITGNFVSVDTESFLNAVCDAGDLSWFYDGAKLHVENAEDIVSRTVPLPHLTRDRIDSVMVTLGYSSGPDGREFEMKAGDRPGMMVFKGPPSFVTSTELLAKDLDEQEAARIKDAVVIRTFHLRYASAQDITVQGTGTSGNSTSTIPGVARAVQNIMATGQGGGAFSTGPVTTERPVVNQTLAGTGLAALGLPVRAPQGGGLDNQQPQQQQQQQPPQPSRGERGGQRRGGGEEGPSNPVRPMIVADARTNSVIIKDVEEHMPMYEELIRQLDIPSKVIQISAAVVDVNSDNVGQFGMQWLGQGITPAGNTVRSAFNADSETFSGSGNSLQTQGLQPSFVDGTNLVRGPGLNFSSLVGGSNTNILTRLQASESLGYTKIVSSPSVLTLENVEAQVSSSSTQYIRIPGYAATDLYDVTAGVEFHVNTAVIEGEKGHIFRMVLGVTDGNFTSTQVDSIPGKNESVINTQAMIPDGKTLLVGGYSIEQKTDNRTQVPFLGRIPLVGRLFGNSQKEHSRSQRFFFITPRVVDVHVEATRPEPTKGKNWIEANMDIPQDLMAKDTEPAKVEQQARGMSYDAWRANASPLLPPPPKATIVVEPPTANGK